MTRATATPQTVDLTPNTPLVTDGAPSQPKNQNGANEQPIVFHSNRLHADGSQVGTAFHIFLMQPDGSNVTPLTGPDAPQQVGQNSNQTEPALDAAAANVVYVDQSSSGAVDIVQLNINSGQTVSLVKNNTSFSFTQLNHPEYGIVPGGSGIGVIFAGVAQNVPGGFHLYAVDTQSGVVTQLTQGSSSDRNPTISPVSPTTQPVIAFDSDRNDPNGNTTKANRDIWVIDANHPLSPATQVTSFMTAENIQPAWSTNKTDQPTGTQQIVKGQQLIGFASTRYSTKNNGVIDGVNPNGTHDIFWLKVNVAKNPNNANLYTVVNPVNASDPPEAASNPSNRLDTGDPGQQYDDTHPTWPAFITSYSLAYQTNRSGYNAGNNSSTQSGSPPTTDIFSSTLIDINAPTLVRFDETTGEILNVTPRNATPGATVTISAKLVDLQSGIRDVWVQIKNPNSKYQSVDGIEHKVYTFAVLTPDGTNGVLNTPVEYESEPIFIGPYDTNGNPTDPRFNTYPRTGKLARAPSYLASQDDFFAYSGNAHPPVHPDPNDTSRDTGWLQMQFVSRDPNTGVATYQAKWTTPNNPSDYYIDVIAYDNALNPFSTGTDGLTGSNWIIYDNVYGFTTQPFNPAHNILFVSDYAPGQKFFNARFGINTLTNVLNTFWGSESWMTDIDVGLLPTQYLSNGGTMPGTVVNAQNVLGVASYFDGLNDDGTRADGRPVPATQQYDLWRILCRGAVPDAVLAQYAPHTEQQPPDSINGETAPRTVLVAPRCVIWHAPFTGDVFTGPGSLTGLQTQLQLHNFLQAGGRLFVNGQDVAWALTLNGASANSFVNGDLQSMFLTDSEPNTSYRLSLGAPIGLFVIYIPSLSNAYQLSGKPAYDPISHDPWQLVGNLTIAQDNHFYPGPPFPPGDQDWIDRDSNYVSGGTVPGPTIRTYMSPDVAFPDEVAPTGSAISDMTYANGNTAVQRLRNTTNNSRVVFAAMGLESLNTDSYSPPGANNTIALKNRRTELMHNAVCWMRTGSIVGQVLDTNGGAPLPNVLVRLDNVRDAKGNVIYAYTGLTRSDGTFSINGVEPATYNITAVKPGFTIQKATFVTTHGGFRDTISFKMTLAEPANISGTVTKTDGTPVPGVKVVATDVTNPNAVFTATTDVQGNYTIQRVPSQTKYTLTLDKATLQQLGFGSSVPTSYPVPNPNDPIASQRDTVVQPSKNYVGFNFVVTPVPGNVTGKVVDAQTNAGIANAVVTATKGSTTTTATTDANGNYTFTGLDTGTWALVASAPGYASNNPAVSVTVVSSQTTTAPTIALSKVPPGTITGLVTRTSDNAPLAGVTVTLYDQTGAQVGQPVVTTSTTATDANGSTYNYQFASVPAGVTYTVKATLTGYTPSPAQQSATVNSGQTTSGINFAMSPLHTFPGALTMVSAPYDYSGSDVGDLLSIPPAARTNGSFEFVTWNLGSYVFYPSEPARTFHLGRGYFLGYKTNLPLATVGTAASITQPFDIPLNPGWNMIGDPFAVDANNNPFNVDWTKVKVVTSGGQVIAHDQAVAQGLISSALYTFTGGTNGGYALDFQLSPWKGYWVHAFQPNLSLRIDPTTDEFGRGVTSRAATSKAVLFGGDGWSINLRLTAGGMHDDDNYLGVTSRAVDGFDGFKVMKPPVFGSQFAYLTFDHTDWGSHAGSFGVDVRSATAAPKSWSFTVQTTAANSSATLSWPNISAVSRKVQVTLTDLATGEVRDMRSNGSYTWQTGDKPAARQFRVDVATIARNGYLTISGVTARATSRAAGGPGAVNIGYTLSAAANVEVRILGANGTLVRRVSGGSTRAAGTNQAVWDQRNEQGISVAAGTYLVEIRAQSTAGSQSARVIQPVTIIR